MIRRPPSPAYRGCLHPTQHPRLLLASATLRSWWVGLYVEGILSPAGLGGYCNTIVDVLLSLYYSQCFVVLCSIVRLLFVCLLFYSCVVVLCSIVVVLSLLVHVVVSYCWMLFYYSIVVCILVLLLVSSLSLSQSYCSCEILVLLLVSSYPPHASPQEQPREARKPPDLKNIQRRRSRRPLSHTYS